MLFGLFAYKRLQIFLICYNGCFASLGSSTESSSSDSEDWSDEESGKLGTEITVKTF